MIPYIVVAGLVAGYIIYLFQTKMSSEDVQDYEEPYIEEPIGIRCLECDLIFRGPHNVYTLRRHVQHQHREPVWYNCDFEECIFMTQRPDYIPVHIYNTHRQ